MFLHRGRQIASFISIFLSIGLAGCGNVIPLQGDVTKLKIVDIVRHIRCETKFAVEDKAIALLKAQPDIASQDLASQLEINRDMFEHFKLSTLPTSKEKIFYKKYIDTAIALEFTFNVTEEDKASLLVDPLGVLTGGMLKVAVNSSADFMRQNVRSFIISDTFGALLSESNMDKRTDEIVCDPNSLPRNTNYPISGSIGLYELIDTFIDLNEKDALRSDQAASILKDSPNTVPVFADTLNFTTTLMGSVAPTLTLSPVGHGLQLADASLTGLHVRTDLHSVIIALSFPPPAKAKTEVKPLDVNVTIVGGLQPQKSVFSKLSVPANSAEERAIAALTQQRTNTFLDRFSH